MIHIFLIFLAFIKADPISDLGWIDASDEACLGHFLLDSPSKDHSLIHLSSQETSYWDGENWHFNTPIHLNTPQFWMEMQAGTWHLADQSWNLEGQVRFFAPPIRLLAAHGTYHAKSEQATLQEIMFRLGPSPHHSTTLWGRAKEGSWNPKSLNMQKATLSLCSPRRNLWSIDAKEATFIQNHQEVRLRHVIPRILGIPVFYLPWLTFSLERQRSTGWLTPQVYFNQGTLFLGLPWYWNITPYMDATLAPMLNTQLDPGATLQFRYLSDFGPFESNALFFKQQDSMRYHIQQATHFLGPGRSLDVQGHIISDDNFLEDYPRFSEGLSWLIPFRMQQSFYNSRLGLDVGIDHYQDFSPTQYAALFPYYHKLPWMKLYGFYPFGSLGMKAMLFYGNYQPTASYTSLFLPQTLTSAQYGINDAWFLGPNLLQYDLEWIDNRIGNDTWQTVQQARGRLLWQRHWLYGSWQWATKAGILLASYQDQTHLPVLDGRPIPLSYQQLFSLDRFTQNSKLGDFQDLDWQVEARHGAYMLGIGRRHAFRLHQVSAYKGLNLYDPLLQEHVSPWLAQFQSQHQNWYLSTQANLGDADNFQFSYQFGWQDQNTHLAWFGFALPIDYPAYQTVPNTHNTKGLGLLWDLRLGRHWTFKSQWFTQLYEQQNGYLLELSYHDCCLQWALGVQKALLPLESHQNAKTQWIAELRFDTQGRILDTISEPKIAPCKVS